VKLAHRLPEVAPPAKSTIGDWRRCPPSSSPFLSADGPNAVWCADFKGWFQTGDRQRCDPLTISDAMSRYLLRCQAVARASAAGVRRGVLRVRAAACDPLGQRAAVRLDRRWRPVAAFGVVDQARLPLSPSPINWATRA
jgi:hypothetical protein